MTAWPDGFATHPGRARRRHSADDGVQPPLEAGVRPSALVAGQGGSAGPTRVRRPGSHTAARQAGPAVDGRRAQRRRRQNRGGDLPRRRHLHRQLDRPVDAGTQPGQGPERQHRAAAGGQRRRRGWPGRPVVQADRAGAVGPRVGFQAHPRRGLRDGPRPGSPDARPRHHRRLRARRRRDRRPRRHGDRRPLVQLGPGEGHRLRRRVRPGTARCRPAAGDQAFPRPRARLRRLAHRRGRHTAAVDAADRRPDSVPDVGDRRPRRA